MAALVKHSKVVKDATSNVRRQFDALDRAREIYLAHIKRAEADYFERLKQATEELRGTADAEVMQPPQQEQQATA